MFSNIVHVAVWKVGSLVIVGNLALYALSVESASPGPGVDVLNVVQTVMTVLGVLIGGLGIYAYSRAMINQKTNEALEQTCKIYREQIDIMSVRIQTLAGDQRLLVEKLTAREKAIAVLESKTDVTALSHALTEIVSTSNERYSQTMSLIGEVLTVTRDNSNVLANLRCRMRDV